jgi:tellurite resistance protein
VTTLEQAAAQYRQAVARSDEARQALHAAILAAVADGTSQKDIVRITGYTRERIRQIQNGTR